MSALSGMKLPPLTVGGAAKPNIAGGRVAKPKDPVTTARDVASQFSLGKNSFKLTKTRGVPAEQNKEAAPKDVAFTPPSLPGVGSPNGCALAKRTHCYATP